MTVMKRLTLADLISGIGGSPLAGAAMAGGQFLAQPVHPVIDSRKAEAGAVFFAFQGERVDGHAYVADAFERGAVAAVIEHDVEVDVPLLDLTAPPFAGGGEGEKLLIRVPHVLSALQDAARWWRKQLSLRVVGVTGSVGKTSTKELVAQVLARRYTVARSGGSYNNEIGLPLTLLELDATHECVVLEMGMYVRGDIRFLAQIARPDVGVVTNVAPVHAERAGTLEEIALGKRELVEALPPAPQGVAILNYGDERVRAMGAHTEARVFTYGCVPEADLWADEVAVLGLEGIRLRLHYGDEVVPVTVPLLGRHSAQTVLRAASVGVVEGLDWAEIVEGLRAPGAQLRLVTVPGPEESLILDDTYNSSPPSALAALDLLAELEGRRVAVLGDMLELGDYEEEGHLAVGCRAAAVVDELVVVGELGELLARGARRCGLAAEQIHAAADSVAAIAVVQALLQPRDLVLVKGSRSVKMEQIVDALRASH